MPTVYTRARLLAAFPGSNIIDAMNAAICPQTTSVSTSGPGQEILRLGPGLASPRWRHRLRYVNRKMYLGMPKTPVWPVAILSALLGLLCQGPCASATPVGSDSDCAAASTQVGLDLWGMMNSWAGVPSAAIDITPPISSAESQAQASASPDTATPPSDLQLSEPERPLEIAHASGGASAPTNSGPVPNSVSVSAVPAVPIGLVRPTLVRYLKGANHLFLPDPYLLALFRPPRASR